MAHRRNCLFYWDTDTLICLLIAYSYSCGTTAGLSSSLQQGYFHKPKIFIIWPMIERVCQLLLWTAVWFSIATLPYEWLHSYSLLSCFIWTDGWVSSFFLVSWLGWSHYFLYPMIFLSLKLLSSFCQNKSSIGILIKSGKFPEELHFLNSFISDTVFSISIINNKSGHRVVS